MRDLGLLGVECAVPGCDRASVQKKRAICKPHADRLPAGTPKDVPAEVLEALSVRRRTGPRPSFKPCSVPGCRERHHARGMCKLHYSTWRYWQTRDQG